MANGEWRIVSGYLLVTFLIANTQLPITNYPSTSRFSQRSRRAGRRQLPITNYQCSIVPRMRDRKAISLHFHIPLLAVAIASNWGRI